MDSSNAPATLSMSCQFRTVTLAKEVEEELNEYFSANLTRTLIPPWQANDHRSLEQRTAHQLARRSYLKAQVGRWTRTENSKMGDLEKQMRKAQRQGDGAETAALRKQIENLSNTLAQERLAKLKAGEEGPVDPEVVDLFSLWSMSTAVTNLPANQKLMRDMAERMGQLPGGNGAGEGTEDLFSTRSGFVSSKGRSLQLNWVSFTRISEGAPALADWLCAKGGTDFTYDILPSTSPIPEEEE